MKNKIIPFFILAIIIANVSIVFDTHEDSSHTSLAAITKASAAISSEGQPVSCGQYQIKDFWHPQSGTKSLYAKLTPSSAITSSATAVNGSLSAAGKSVKVTGGVCSSATYTVSVIHYECKYSWLSPECIQKEEYTMYTFV
jgi:hypothetical protein